MKIYILLFVLFFASLPIIKGQENKDALRYYLQAKKAYDQKLMPAYYTNIKAAYLLRPDHPSIIQSMSRAYALLDSVNQCIGLLIRIWEMGLQADITDDKDFNSIKKDPRYPSLVKRLALNKLPLNRSDTAFLIEEKGLITEGIAYDSNSNTILVGSVRKGKILTYQNQKFTGYLKGIEREGSILGMKVDPKDNILWICSSFLPQYEHLVDSLKGTTRIIKYDLKKGHIIHRYRLKKDKHPHSFGDLTLSPKGRIYITDSETPDVYTIDPLSDQLEPIYLFPLSNPPFALQGLTFSDDGRYLFIADYLKGIYKIDLKKNTSSILKHPGNITTVGIDGLYFYKNSLIAIQNGVEPNRVIQFRLNHDFNYIEAQRFLEANHPSFDEPTLGVIKGDDFLYLPSSQWTSMYNQGKPINHENLKPALVLTISLKSKRP